jgi:hypothetical protein
VLVGLNLYQGSAASMRRQELAVRALSKLPGVEILNVQFQRAPWATLPGIEMKTALTTSSITVAGPGGHAKPMTREFFDVLCRTAAERGHDYFAYINSDIVVLPAAMDEVVRLRRETYTVSRHDVDNLDGDPASGTAVTSGLDMFVVSVDWWGRNCHRFRPYVVGDSCWDNVYAAVMMCHSNGVILNRDPLILHERHPVVWNDATPTARYNGFVAALDARYLSIWCQYWERLKVMRDQGASATDERALQVDMFLWRPSAAEAAKQTVRSIRARLRYWRLRRELAGQPGSARAHVSSTFDASSGRLERRRAPRAASAGEDVSV